MLFLQSLFASSFLSFFLSTLRAVSQFAFPDQKGSTASWPMKSVSCKLTMQTGRSTHPLKSNT